MKLLPLFSEPTQQIAANLLESLSPSQLSVWNDCEQRWEYAYVKKYHPRRGRVVAFEKGSYIHEIMHYYYSLVREFGLGNEIVLQSVQERFKQDLMNYMDECNSIGIPIDMNFYRDVTKTIVDYIQLQSPVIDKGMTEILVEHHLEYVYDGRLFHGFADLMYKKEGKWHIRDHKSGAKNTYETKYVERVEQLLFYGTIFYKLTGEVAIPEINFIHSSPPTKSRVGTVIFGLFEASHTASSYETYWNHLLRVHEKQKSSQVERNYSACKYCAYYPICRADLRRYSAENIIKYRYGPIQDSDSTSSGVDSTGFTLNLGGQRYHY